ncbi:hypothetical protein SRHO_G00023800 [Serrasalmus rhombeus]
MKSPAAKRSCELWNLILGSDWLRHRSALRAPLTSAPRPAALFAYEEAESEKPSGPDPQIHTSTHTADHRTVRKTNYCKC